MDLLRDDFLPGLTDRGQCLVFTPSKLPPELHLGPEADPRRVLLPWLAPEDVRAGWDAHFDEHERAVAAAGVGAVTYLSPFIPAVPGADTHVDEVR